MKLDKKQNRLRRARKARAKISELEKNRLTVHRTPRHIYAQVIGPDGGTVLLGGIKRLREGRNEEGVPMLALGAIGLTVAYGMARLMANGFQQLRDAIFAAVGQRALIGADGKLAGASFSALSWKNFARMTLCGQTKAQLPRWMHRSGSHDGTRSETLPFSNIDVALGYVPSIGNLLTGNSSPGWIA